MALIPGLPSSTTSHVAVIAFARNVLTHSGLRDRFTAMYVKNRRLPPESEPERRAEVIAKFESRVDQLLIGLLVNALKGNAVHRKGVVDVFAHGDTPAAVRDAHGFTVPSTINEREACEKRLDRAWNEICDELDPANTDSIEEGLARFEELITITGDLLGYTWSLLPRWMRRAYRGDLTTDGTFVSVRARPGAKTRIPKPADDNKVATYDGEKLERRFEKTFTEIPQLLEQPTPTSREGTWDHDRSNPFAGYYQRPNSIRWGMELTLVACTDSERAYHSRGVPALALGAGLFTPGAAISDIAVMILRDLQRLDLPRRYLACDTPYGNTASARFATPVRELGYQLLNPHAPGQRGYQGTWGPVSIIDGDLYAHCIPDVLKYATENHDTALAALEKKYEADRKRKDADQPTLRTQYEADKEELHTTLQELLAKRELYRTKVHEYNDGVPYRVSCLANANVIEIACDNSPSSKLEARRRADKAANRTTGRRSIPLRVNETPSADRETLCKQASVKLDPDATAEKYKRLHRPLPPMSTAFEDLYHGARNTSESVNAFVKDPAFEAIESHWRRRASGLAANMLLLTMQLFAGNIRKLRTYLDNEEQRQQQAAGGARDPRYNRTKRQPAYGPHGSVDTDPGDADLPAWLAGPQPLGP